MAVYISVLPPEEMPLMPLREVVMFPKAIAPLFVGRESSIKSIENAIARYDRHIFLVSQRDSSVTRPAADDLFKIGAVSRILQLLRLPDGTIKVLVEGMYRAHWKPLRALPAAEEGDDPFRTVRVRRFEEAEAEGEENPGGRAALIDLLEEYAKFNKKLTPSVLEAVTANRRPGALADAVAPHIKADYLKKQAVLEEADPVKRLDMVLDMLQAEVLIWGMDRRIKSRVKTQMERNQREYYLNEQIKAIHKEMGKEENSREELDDLEKAVNLKKLPDEARDKALHELKKLRRMPSSSAEYTVLRNYVDWILDLPWNELKATSIDLDKARGILNADHHGLDKAKERILEYLAVQKLAGSLKGPILCLVGPPGVGKTSLARSVASATGREFARLSLGGVRDEAEIRGHRRTYVGALPGKIIQSLKRVRSNNPLFCLDEIDKLSTDFRGDPASALLEVLDPEQNYAFVDHYLDLDYDLSQIFFITTANSLHGISLPLQDRMEIIKLPGYLETEKQSIGRHFLMPRQIEAHGLTSGNVRLSENALLEIIRCYTKEAGVRNLERELARICRKTAVKIAEADDGNRNVTVSCRNLPEFLGVKKFRYGERENDPQAGVCTGLAYTELGGELLLVETALMPGTGKVLTTGKLGEVMQESAQAALSYVRSRAELFGLRRDFHKDIDIHVHVPEGAVPKDGPSAGITLTTSLVSALLGVPVRNDLAMTGEITLRGRVLPIGGIREKLLAAHRGLISTVILPKDNERDLKDVPEEILKGLTLVFVRHVDQVLPCALVAESEEIFPGRSESHPLHHSLRRGECLDETPAAH
ncbi:MAG: endopeptidase La [Desulfovibrio sp.]|jgi:ATP-dependent Lon protease|nr:endopeptidase La [Desulfovibrio sp.]